MQKHLFRLFIKLQSIVHNEEGQDLVEYAMLCSLIALVAITSVNFIAPVVTIVFSNVSSSLA